MQTYARRIPGGTIDVDLRCDDDEDENLNDDNTSGGNGKSNKSKSGERRSYKPSSGSVKEYLDELEKRVKDNDATLSLEKGAAWVPPPWVAYPNQN